MNIQAKPLAAPVRQETMRIAGRSVDTDERIEVLNPYTNSVAGTVPSARPEHVREAFAAAKAFRPQLSRYERQRILMTTAEKLQARRDELARLITAESGLCMKDSTYEVGRAYDVFSLAGQLAIHDDGEILSCDITPHGKSRRIYTTRQPLLGVI